jgi:hypothetical protein
MHICFKIIKFYFTLRCSTCFGHYCFHYQELPTTAPAASGYRVMLCWLRPPALFIQFYDWWCTGPWTWSCCIWLVIYLKWILKRTVFYLNMYFYLKGEGQQQVSRIRNLVYLKFRITLTTVGTQAQKSENIHYVTCLHITYNCMTCL